MDSVNLTILKLLSKGFEQHEISQELKKKGITPNSLSTIEKRLKEIKKEYKVKTNFQLAVRLTKKGTL